MKINEGNLDQRLEQHSSMLGFFNCVLAYAKKMLEKENLSLQILSAKCKEERRDSVTKKIPAHEMQDYIDAQDEITEQKSKIVTAEYKYNMAKGIVSALTSQKDLLVQISSNRRHEQRLLTE